MIISVIGTGYVGLTTGAILAAVGHKVYCVDIDAHKLEVIRSGRSFFYEPGLDFFVAQGIKTNKLIPTLSYKEAISQSEIAMICVGTPTKENMEVDVSYVMDATKEIGKNMKDGMIIIQKSTVPVGTGREMEKLLQGFNKKFNLVSCPEFLSEGTAVIDTLNVNRFVVGGDNENAKKKVIKLFKTIDDYARTIDLKEYSEYENLFKTKGSGTRNVSFSQKVLSISLESAELIKVTANAFLATKISFANSIARLCDVTGANIDEVMEGIGRDERIGRSFLYAGLGWGGGCFPKDTMGLVSFSKKNNFDFPLLSGAIKTNSEQINYIAKIINKINPNKKHPENCNIAVLGLAFKPGTSDVRISPPIALIKELSKDNKHITVYDPQATEEAKKELKNIPISYADSSIQCCANADIIILATQWPEFVKMDFTKIRDNKKEQFIIDARNSLNRGKLESLGFHYIGIGR